MNRISTIFACLAFCGLLFLSGTRVKTASAESKTSLAELSPVFATSSLPVNKSDPQDIKPDIASIKKNVSDSYITTLLKDDKNEDFIYSNCAFQSYASCLDAKEILIQKIKKDISRNTKKPVTYKTALSTNVNNKPDTENKYNTQVSETLNFNLIFDMVNNYRQRLGLGVFEKDEKLCQLVESRIPELYNEIFITGRLHSGLHKRDIPYRVNENLVYGQNEQKAFNWWLNSRIHRLAITGDYKYSCGECTGNICIQLFTNYSPKQS